MFNFKDPALYVKGTADLAVYNVQTGDLEAYTDTLDTTNLTSSINDGAINGGLGSPVLIYIPDGSTFGGEVTAQDFSLKARQFQTGGQLTYNAPVMIMEKITPTDTTLTVTQTPVPAPGDDATAATYQCFVGDDVKNYGVDPETKQVQGFTAVAGTEYCVKYYINVASAQQLTIPSVFQPGVKRIVVRMACYTAQGLTEKNSSFNGYLYIHIPYAQFVGGDAGVNGSQTENATTTWTFQALSFKQAVQECSECAQNNALFGYMIYAPCGDRTAAVQELVVSGGGISVAESAQEQIPVFYLMPDQSLITPNYSELAFESEAPATATVTDEGVVEGVLEGSTTVNISLKNRPEVKTTCEVQVTAAG